MADEGIGGVSPAGVSNSILDQITIGEPLSEDDLTRLSARSLEEVKTSKVILPGPERYYVSEKIAGIVAQATGTAIQDIIGIKKYKRDVTLLDSSSMYRLCLSDPNRPGDLNPICVHIPSGMFNAVFSIHQGRLIQRGDVDMTSIADTFTGDTEPKEAANTATSAFQSTGLIQLGELSQEDLRYIEHGGLRIEPPLSATEFNLFPVNGLAQIESDNCVIRPIGKATNFEGYLAPSPLADIIVSIVPGAEKKREDNLTLFKKQRKDRSSKICYHLYGGGGHTNIRTCAYIPAPLFDAVFVVQGERLGFQDPGIMQQRVAGLFQDDEPEIPDLADPLSDAADIVESSADTGAQASDGPSEDTDNYIFAGIRVEPPLKTPEFNALRAEDFIDIENNGQRIIPYARRYLAPTWIAQHISNMTGAQICEVVGFGTYKTSGSTINGNPQTMHQIIVKSQGRNSKKTPACVHVSKTLFDAVFDVQDGKLNVREREALVTRLAVLGIEPRSDFEEVVASGLAKHEAKPLAQNGNQRTVNFC